MHAKSTKEIGKVLENRFLAELQKYEPKARLTRNSGGSVEKLDVSSRYFAIECKHRRKTRSEFLLDDWQKLLVQAPKCKVPVYVVQNKSGRIGIMFKEQDLWPAVWTIKNLVHFEGIEAEYKTISITDDEWIIDNPRPETVLLYKVKTTNVWGHVVICGWDDFWRYLAKPLLEDR